MFAVSVCNVGPSLASSGCLPSQAAERELHKYCSASNLSYNGFVFKKTELPGVRNERKNKNVFPFQGEKTASWFNGWNIAWRCVDGDSMNSYIQSWAFHFKSSKNSNIFLIYVKYSDIKLCPIGTELEITACF